MDILPDSVIFDWDEGNSDKNWIKHKVSKQEAEEIFINKPLLVFEDPEHSRTEKRSQALGKTNKSRGLFAIFTTRDEKIRVISIRDMSRKEEKIYEEAKKTAKV